MTNTDVVNKLVGRIHPVADAAIDSQRMESMKSMCELVRDLLLEIDYVAYSYRQSPYGSAKEIGVYADKFIKETIGELRINPTETNR